MKKLLSIAIILSMAVLCPTLLHAQSGLNINNAFTPAFCDLKGATETLISKDRLRGISINVYHSLSIAGHPEASAGLERLVRADGAKALSKEVRYRSGRLYYGFYRLPDYRSMQRYIIYLNGTLTGDGKIILLYVEGKIHPDDVKKLLK